MYNDTSVLLIDNSNGRTKFRLWKQSALGAEVRVIPTAEISESRVQRLLRDWQFSSVAICSVVPETADILSRSFRCPVDFLDADAKLPIDFSSYPGRATLGADRVANAVGALEWNQFPAIIVDLGTAITFDVVIKDTSAGYLFSGGVIAPGLSLFKEYLSSRTALLPPVYESGDLPKSYIGKNTQEALRLGFLSGAKGMILSILEDISASLNSAPFIIATGGDAGWAAEHLSEINLVDAHLTFRGLAKFVQN